MASTDRTGTRRDETPLLNAGNSSRTQRGARLALAIVLLAAVAWIAHSYLQSLAWAILIAIATWPLYVRFTKGASAGTRRSIAPLAFTLLASLIVLGPLLVIAIG